MSRCGKREGLAGDQSSLFWYYVEALRTLHPKWFLFENVYSMSRITGYFTVTQKWNAGKKQELKDRVNHND